MKDMYLKLLGLARACDNNEHMLTEGTFALVREVLDASASSPALLTRLSDEKRRIAPMCFDCASPCGRTAGPASTLFEDRELLAIDLELLQRLLRCGLACYGEAELHRLLQRTKEIFG